MVQVAMGDEPGLGPHEGPGLSAEVEADFEFGYPPIGLHCRAGIALDGQVLVSYGFDRKIVDHALA